MEDYGSYDEKPEQEDFAKLTSLVNSLHEAVQTEIAATERLEVARAVREDLEQRQIPEFMASLGLEECVTRNGLRVKLKTQIFASIPKKDSDRREAAFKWLRDHGYGRLVKHHLDVPLGRVDNSVILEITKQLAERGLEAQDIMDIHPSTLKAFVKERMTEGEELPQELFGVHRIIKADVTTK